jgi:hypothetical protein
MTFTTKIQVTIDVAKWEETFCEFSNLMKSEHGRNEYALLKLELQKMDDIINLDYFEAFRNMVLALKTKLEPMSAPETAKVAESFVTSESEDEKEE